jgi:serine protease
MKPARLFPAVLAVLLGAMVSLNAGAAGNGALSPSPVPSAEQIIEQARFNASTNRMIVKLRPSPSGLAQPMSGEHMNTLMTRAGQPLRVLRRVGGDGAHLLQLDGSLPNSDAKALAQKLAEDPAVEYAQPDYRMHALATIPNDPRFAQQWYLSDNSVGLNLPAAWENFTTGNGVIVAVLDTGIVAHADIDGARILPGYDFISPDTASGGTTVVAGDGNGRDANPTDPGDRVTAFDQATLNGIFGAGSCPLELSSWHGTQVASVIAASTNNAADIAGVNWNALILPMRVLGRCGGFTSDIVEAMRWAAGLHVAGVPDNPQANRAQVLNLSLGVSREPCTQFEQTAFNEVLSAGVVKAIVTAAGNDGALADNSSPGGCVGALNVAGVLPNGKKAELSNFGARVTVAAPYGTSSPDGVGSSGAILTLGNSGDSSYVPGGDIVFVVGGTSFSAPLVSGIVSLMLSVNPNLTASQVYDIVRQSARAFPSGSNCPTLGCGAGTVDAPAALALASNNLPAPRSFPNAADGGGGCSMSRGAADWSLVLLLLVACGYAWRRRARQ